MINRIRSINARDVNNAGYRAWKIHAWPRQVPEDGDMMSHEPPLFPSQRCVEFFRQAREAMGSPDEFTIIADCHYHYCDPTKHPWTVDDAVTLAKGLHELGIVWLEGLPFVADRPEVYRRLKQDVPGLRLQQEFPNGMSEQQLAQVWKGMREHPELIDVQAGDPHLLTFTENVRIARWCIRNRKLFDSHWPDGTSLQFAAAMTDQQYPFFETSEAWHHDIRTQRGVVNAPTEPGLMPIRFPVEQGVFQTVDWDYVQDNGILP